MSTTTNYYALTKPELSDPADIRAINGNMDTLDTVLHGSQVSLADAFDQTKAYSAGDVVMYQFYMYKFTEDKAAGNWDATKVERTTAAETGGGEVDFDLFGEASGNPASFADGSESALVECEFNFEPVQDLHGYSKPWAGGAGVNQWDEEWEVGALRATDGAPVPFNNRIRSVNYSPCDPNTNYYAYIGFNVQLRVYWYKSDYTNISYSTGNQVITSPANAAFFKITTEGTTYGETYRNDIAVNNPSTITTYSPYSNICPISGHSSVTINVSPTNDTSQGVDTTIQLGDTYYGGTLNAVTGELTVTHGIITLDGSESWDTNSQNGFTIYNKLFVSSNRDVGWCDRFEIITTVGSTNMGIILGINNRHIYATYITDNMPEITNVTSWKNWLSNNNLTIIAELATPITVHLPPTTINTLLGQNYVSSEDTEDIDLVYTKSAAPIKPNPSGTPSGELRSIEIGGEIFEIIKELPTFPTSDGDYKLKLSVSSGEPTLSWVSDT